MSSRTTRKRKIQTPTTDTLPDKPNKIDKSLPETIYPEETRVSKDFFDKSSYDLARALLGKILVHKVDGELVKCIIIETELYPGGDDKASVSYNNRRTPANEPVFGPPGTTWVYLTYGMHHCINISSADHGGAVLLRAGEPLDGLDKLMELRIKNMKMSRDLKIKDLCNGPAKLYACKAMGIDETWLSFAR
ncbi:DNA-3-methyladenine glycosylase-like [Atheta coriaria]|uniref:DNA-3-methyladenine glycosylase-like n=1 Tax=Dalotia coriaria TaxID=877792 RepID=UPI0031F3652F